MRNFQKVLDKLKNIWYNIYTNQSSLGCWAKIDTTMARMGEIVKPTTTNHHMLGCNSRTCHFARMTLRISSICLKAYPTPPTTKPPWDTLYSDVAQWLEPPSYRGRPEFDFSASLPAARPHSKFINEVKVQRFMKSMSTVRFCCK